LRSKKLSYRDKIKLCLYFTEIKEIFRTYDENIAMERLESLLDEYDDVPCVLQGYIRKKILPDFERLTQFMRDPFVSRTTCSKIEDFWHAKLRLSKSRRELLSSGRPRSDKEEI